MPFLGAGVSVEQGVPAWRELVLSMLFDRGHGAGFVERLPPALHAAVTAWLTGHLGYDLTVLARVVEVAAPRGERWTEREFLEQLRRRLYPPRRRRPEGPTTLDAVADFIADGAREGRVPAVITLNYDDLLERALRARGVPHHPVWSARRTRGAGLPVRRCAHPLVERSSRSEALPAGRCSGLSTPVSFPSPSITIRSKAPASGTPYSRASFSRSPAST